LQRLIQHLLQGLDDGRIKIIDIAVHDAVPVFLIYFALQNVNRNGT